MISGDEDDYGLDDDDESEAEGICDDAEDEDNEATSDEKDPVELSVGTSFHKISKEQLSDHAKSGWATYFDEDCRYCAV
ncbi:hypothetical protein DVH05_010402 [Phytophthora capsici]|nr:hypothetical protein DVH05_010402 [Phytophthora capsici]